MPSVGMYNHGLSEKSIAILTIHDNARTVVEDLYERSIVTLTIHANARTVTNMHTQVPIVRVSLTIRVTLTIPEKAQVIRHVFQTKFSTVFQSACYIVKNKKATHLCTELDCNIGLSLYWKAFSENTTSHQQHWANSIQKSPRQPLVRDWLITPETLMMLNCHCLKYRGRFVQG